MSNINAKSQYIKIFPISKDRLDSESKTDSSSRLLSEQNLSSIFEKLAGTPSCIVDYSMADNTITRIDFLLNGRYISLSDNDLLRNANLYVKLEYSSNNYV